MVELKLEVGMTCGGCSGAVERILSKVDGVSNVACDIEAKSVVVTASDDSGVTAEQLVAKLQKWSDASGKYVKVA
eukprot:CAMPEP_0204612850 /NCGR_PEP_ID=MMETSP0717-20131115/902_1 /ASSEMBLY_ACC=CAM_ASM_000666 /TAXON_ID=230516 /ORGANISM="Chaetoceros curvisetus" /LENGTH=74 /DNA_ID=CAMNT_0051625079 /DNA_START=11 /DNA_END=235 /DNA_ORIENTATION=-